MSKEKRIMSALGEVDEKYIVESAPVNMAEKKKPLWPKLAAMAACLVGVAALGAGLLQSGLFGDRTETVAFNNGDKIVFERADTVAASFAADFEVTVKPLTKDETAAIFGDLPATIGAVFKGSDIAATTPRELIGFEGEIGNVKAVISTADVPLLDTVIVGTEGTSKLNGVSIVAGYFITDPNSRGEQNAIYYASFELGDCKVYLENAGTKDDSERTKNQLAEIIQMLTENGWPKLTF